MPSIFDTLLGLNSPTTPGLNPALPNPAATPSMLTPFGYKASNADTLLGLSQGLLAAGSPSPYPVDFGTAIGKGIGAANTAQETGEEKYLKRALTGAQVEKARQDIANDQAWQAMFKTPAQGAGPQAAVVPPVIPGGGPSNPTNPGNITDGKGGFISPPTPEAGVAAAVKLAQSYPATYNNGQPMSLAQIEAHWSPPDNGKDPLTKGNKQGVWSGNVARAMGIDPNVPVDFNDPANGLAFAKAVHIAEHPPGSAYAPDVYQRGTQMAYGAQPAVQIGPPPTATPIPNAVPGQAQVQLAGGPAPQALAAPSAAPPAPTTGQPPTMAPVGVPPAVQPAKPLQQVIQELPPAVRQMMGAMPRKDALPLLMKYADPETHVAIDTQTGQIVFAPKIDNSGRFQPVDAMKLDLDKQRIEVEKRQAAAREEANNIRNRNEPVIPGPNGTTVPNPTLPGAKGAITGAEESAKVLPQIQKYQAEEAIKDHQLAQAGAAKARSANANLDHLSTLLDGINTGKMKGSTTELKAWAKGAGIDLDALGIKDDVGPIQAANKLLSQMALDARSTAEGGGMPGSMSDSDRQFLVGMTPGVETTPEGRKLITDFTKAVNQRVIDAARIKNDYVRSGKFTTDPAGMWAEIDKKYSATLPDGSPNPSYVPLIDPSKAASLTGAPSASPAVSAINAIDAELARRGKPQSLKIPGR